MAISKPLPLAHFMKKSCKIILRVCTTARSRLLAPVKITPSKLTGARPTLHTVGVTVFPVPPHSLFAL